MKKKVCALVLAGLLVVLSGCGSSAGSSGVSGAAAGSEASQAAVAEGAQLKLGLLLSPGGLGDQNFNDAAYAGMQMAEEQYGITFDYSEPESTNDFEALITEYAQTGEYDLIFINASEGQTALEVLAPQYPDQNFAIMDVEVDSPNVRSILKDFNDYSFFGGYLAGLLTTDTSLPGINEKADVGILLGMDIPTMQQAGVGFTAGAKLANPDTEVHIGIAGSFEDANMGKEITKSMYDGGADIVMAMAGGTGLGLINQAKESGLYAIGVTSNQNSMAPDNVIASAVENLPNRILAEVEDLTNGSWSGGIVMCTLANDYFELVYEGSNVEIPQDILDKVAAVEQARRDGMELPQTHEEIDAWLAGNPLG